MNILVLDGGGSKGLASARFLQQFEQVLGPVPTRFDLVCGVSTGAILGALLCSGMSSTGVCELYEDRLAEIFPPRGLKVWRGLTCPKYPADPLEDILGALWRDLPLGKLNPPGSLGMDLMVLATKLSPRITPKVWKSWDPKDAEVRLRDLVRASTAAPAYFPPKVIEGEVYVDGGLCTNEPSMCALAEAVRRTGTVAQHKILTIRPGGVGGFGFEQARQKTSPLHWLWDISGVMFQCSERVAEYQAHQLIGFSNHVVSLGMPGELDTTGVEHNQACIKAAQEAWGAHEAGLRNQFGLRAR